MAEYVDLNLAKYFEDITQVKFINEPRKGHLDILSIKKNTNFRNSSTPKD